jgi:hypothetical protein
MACLFYKSPAMARLKFGRLLTEGHAWHSKGVHDKKALGFAMHLR